MIINARPMLQRDRPDVMRILQNTPEFKPSEVTIAEELIDSYLDDLLQSGYYVLVAEVDQSVSGYVCFGPTPLTEGTWDIYWIAVSRDRQNQGIGKVLMTSAETRINSDKGRLVLIETSSIPEYDKTRNFYLSQGYEVVCQIPDFYAPGDDKIVYQKRLR